MLLWADCCPAPTLSLGCLQLGQERKEQGMSAKVMHRAYDELLLWALAVVGCPLPLIFHRPPQVSWQVDHGMNKPI